MIRKDPRSSCLNNFQKSGVWTEIDEHHKDLHIKSTAMRLRVVYMPNYNLEAWGPLWQKPGDMCFDLRVAMQSEIHIFPGEMKVIKLGVAFDLPANIGLEVYPRSSLCKRGLMLANHVGIIDPSYRGELIAPLFNFSKEAVFLDHGDRILQAKIVRRNPVTFEAITQDEMTETERGTNGFGSTGRT